MADPMDRRPGETFQDWTSRLQRDYPTTWQQKLDTVYRLLDDPVQFIESAITKSGQKKPDDVIRETVRSEVLRILFFGYIAWKVTR